MRKGQSANNTTYLVSVEKNEETKKTLKSAILTAGQIHEFSG